MDKRAFLRSTCQMGICSCAGALALARVAFAAPERDELARLRDQNGRLDWRFNHARRQFVSLLTEIEPLIDGAERGRIMRRLGRNCATALGWAEQYKGNPEGFFEHMQRVSGETLTIDESRRVISVVTRERPCDCPLVASAKPPAYYCDCSLGWQMQTYETILGRPVEVVLKESVLRGSTRCVFEVRIV
jgi:predicted hydrocarbon binding protein